MTARARDERIELRTTSEVRRLVEQAAAASGSSLTEFAETSVVECAQRILADRDQFELAGEAKAAWDAINDRPARDLPGLRRLMERPSPFEG